MSQTHATLSQVPLVNATKSSSVALHIRKEILEWLQFEGVVLADNKGCVKHYHPLDTYIGLVKPHEWIVESKEFFGFTLQRRRRPFIGIFSRDRRDGLVGSERYLIQIYGSEYVKFLCDVAGNMLREFGTPVTLMYVSSDSGTERLTWSL